MWMCGASSGEAIPRNPMPASSPMTSSPTNSLRFAVAAVVLVHSAACRAPGDMAAGGDLTTTFDTINGVVQVVNAGEPSAWQLVPVVSIGPKEITDQAGPDEFGRVASVALGPGGEVFVGDAINGEVRVFGLDGEHLRTFGRHGEGPGEFQSIYSLAWVGGRLLVYDPGLGRIGEFSAEGEWLGQRRTEGGWTGSPARLRIYHVGPDEFFRLTFSRYDETSLWLGYRGSGEAADTVPFLVAEDDLPGRVEPVFCEAESSIGFFAAPFASGFVQHPASGGVMVSAWGYFYRIAVTAAATGDTLRVIERTATPVPVTDEEWAVGNAEYDEFRERFADADCQPRGFSRPDRKPFIDELYMAPDGRLWVEAIRADGHYWEFFDAEGRLLGSVPAPAYKERSVPTFQGDLIATIRQDELELDHVELWRLERLR